MKFSVKFTMARDLYDRNIYIEAAKRVVFRNCMNQLELDDMAAVTQAEVARLIDYRRLNFADPVPPSAGMFDIVFCRNVLIYFDEALKRRVVEEFWRALPPGGILVLGSAESLYGISDRFLSVTMGGSPVYQRI